MILVPFPRRSINLPQELEYPSQLRVEVRDVMMATIPILLGNVKVDLDGERYTPPPIYGDLDLYREGDDTLAFIPPKKLL